jgi:hypothetical protein
MNLWQGETMIHLEQAIARDLRAVLDALPAPRTPLERALSRDLTHFAELLVEAP